MGEGTVPGESGAGFARLILKPIPGGSSEGAEILIPAGTCVAEVLKSLPLPAAPAFLPTVNGTVVDLDTVLKPGDILRLLPQISGG